jgi:opacity protein-like surface antigen
MKFSQKLYFITLLCSVSISCYAELVAHELEDGQIRIYKTDENGNLIKAQDVRPISSAKETVIETESLEIEIEEREVHHEEGWFDEISPVISFRVGLDNADVGKSQNVNISPLLDAPYYYKRNDNSFNELVLGGFLGIEIPLDEDEAYSWQTGVSYYHTQPFHIKGVEQPNADSSINDASFSYTVTNQRVMFENKLLAALNERFYFYLLAGVGAAFNNAHDFDQTALDPSVVLNPGFEDKKTSSVSWSVGLGLEAEVFANTRVSLGYQFSDLGKVELGHLDGPNTTDETLSSSHTNTSEFILGLSYLFD